MIVSAIVAVANNGVIGDGQDIPWRLAADLRYFKRITLEHHVIMGRKTFESIGKPLPKRTNIVLSRDPFYTASGIIVARTIEEALTIAFDQGETEAFIIGGGEIYRQSQTYWDKVYLTRVAVDAPGQVYFPDLAPDTWQLLSTEAHQADDKNDHDYQFQVYSLLNQDL